MSSNNRIKCYNRYENKPLKIKVIVNRKIITLYDAMQQNITKYL